MKSQFGIFSVNFEKSPPERRRTKHKSQKKRHNNERIKVCREETFRLPRSRELGAAGEAKKSFPFIIGRRMMLFLGAFVRYYAEHTCSSSSRRTGDTDLAGDPKQPPTSYALGALGATSATASDPLTRCSCGAPFPLVAIFFSRPPHLPPTAGGLT